MSDQHDVHFDGGCDCRAVRYRMSRAPLFVNCCHCRWCQRETGSAFVLNALIESENVTLLNGKVELVDTPSHSGGGQRIARCPQCRIALWSHYGGIEALSFMRVGTFDEPDNFPPDIHIFTQSKQPWVVLAPDKPVMDAYYDREQYWSEANLERRRLLFANMAR